MPLRQPPSYVHAVEDSVMDNLMLCTITLAVTLGVMALGLGLLVLPPKGLSHRKAVRH